MMRFLINCIITISFILCFHLISEVYAEDDDPNIFNGVLFAACTSERGVDNVDEVKFALSKGAEINHRQEHSGQTPLFAAVLRGKTNIVKYLLSQGADTSITEIDGYTLVHGAAFQGRPAVMDVLLDHGLDVGTFHNDGFLPIHRACWGMEKRHAKTVRLLIEKGGVDMNIMSRSPAEAMTCEQMTKNKETLSVLQNIQQNLTMEDSNPEL